MCKKNTNISEKLVEKNIILNILEKLVEKNIILNILEKLVEKNIILKFRSIIYLKTQYNNSKSSASGLYKNVCLS